MNFRRIKTILGLSFSLAKANFKLKNENSYLGIFWYLLEPLSLFVILLTIKQIAFNDIENYTLYLFLGLIIFNFFSKATIKSCKSINNNAGIIKSIKTPLEPFVFSDVLESLFSHIFEVILFSVFLFFLGKNPINIFYYFPILVFLFLFISGLSFILASLGTYLSDIDNIWRVATKFIFFATPLFYSAPSGSFISKFNLFNPLFYYIEISREIIIYNNFNNFFLFFVSVFLSVFFFALGLYIFEKLKKRFAEFI